jgi:hypothetical protein
MISIFLYDAFSRSGFRGHRGSIPNLGPTTGPESRLPTIRPACYRISLTMSSSPISGTLEVVIQIGGIPIALRTTDPAFLQLLRNRYANYVTTAPGAAFAFDVDLVSATADDPDADVRVWMQNGDWQMVRGDFRADWNPQKRYGRIRQTPNPYAIDSVLRIVHTLLLAPEGGFLLHASSAIRNGKAFLFSGLSEAGKTTMARLAPADAILLTDEASYVRKSGEQYLAFGTPFAGDLGEPGKNVSAPIAALYLLAKASENRITPIDPTEAVRRLMRNILFFTHDAELVRLVFQSACAFTAAVPVFQLSFFPDPRVWDLIG